MNIELMSLRIIHIVFGAFWVGSAVFMVLIFLPRVQRLPTDTRDTLMEAVVKPWSMVMGAVAFVTVAVRHHAGPQTALGAPGYILVHRLGLGHPHRIRISYPQYGPGWAL